MSDIWIKSCCDLRDHPKVGKLARALGVPRMQAIGMLHGLWWWAARYAPDGNLSGVDDSDIAEACDWDGECNALRNALCNAGFIESSGMLHDWSEYTGGFLSARSAARAKARDRVRRYRERKTRDVTANVSVTEPLRNANETRTKRECNTNVTPLEVEVEVDKESESLRTLVRRRRTQSHVEGMASDDAERFERWWTAYPRKENKRRALEWWAKHRPAEAQVQAMIAAVERQRYSLAWTREGGQFIPMPSTWLNGERWNDQGIDPLPVKGARGTRIEAWLGDTFEESV